jgi:hypothetical protein
MYQQFSNKFIYFRLLNLIFAENNASDFPKLPRMASIEIIICFQAIQIGVGTKIVPIYLPTAGTDFSGRSWPETGKNDRVII